MKCQILFSGKDKKNISKCHLLKVLPRVLSVKNLCIQTIFQLCGIQGPVVQNVVSLTSLLRVILLTVLADSIYNILIFFAEKM